MFYNMDDSMSASVRLYGKAPQGYGQWMNSSEDCACAHQQNWNSDGGNPTAR